MTREKHHSTRKKHPFSFQFSKIIAGSSQKSQISKSLSIRKRVLPVKKPFNVIRVDKIDEKTKCPRQRMRIGDPRERREGTTLFRNIARHGRSGHFICPSNSCQLIAATVVRLPRRTVHLDKEGTAETPAAPFGRWTNMSDQVVLNI